MGAVSAYCNPAEKRAILAQYTGNCPKIPVYISHPSSAPSTFSCFCDANHRVCMQTPVVGLYWRISSGIRGRVRIYYGRLRWAFPRLWERPSLCSGNAVPHRVEPPKTVLFQYIAPPVTQPNKTQHFSCIVQNPNKSQQIEKPDKT